MIAPKLKSVDFHIVRVIPQKCNFLVDTSLSLYFVKVLNTLVVLNFAKFELYVRSLIKHRSTILELRNKHYTYENNQQVKGS